MANSYEGDVGGIYRQRKKEEEECQCVRDARRRREEIGSAR